VEGYEVILMPYFTRILSRFKPSIQIELGTEEHRKTIVELLKPLGYQPYKLEEKVLMPLSSTEVASYSRGDFYFLQAN
jgi:hypothetical protein